MSVSLTRNQDSSFGIATGCGLDGQGSTPGRGTIFLFSTASSPALGTTTQPPIKWVLWSLYPDVKRMGCEADHSPQSSIEVRNGGAMPPLLQMSSWHNA
jgi:hypothetical protein